MSTSSSSFSSPSFNLVTAHVNDDDDDDDIVQTDDGGTHTLRDREAKTEKKPSQQIQRVSTPPRDQNENDTMDA